jgi:hypothetical protein
MTAPRSYSPKAIRLEMTVRQIAVDFPASRNVFRHYGEPDSQSGQFGHLEPLAHFAQRKGVALDGLLVELRAATGVPVDATSRYAERVHHGFLMWALVVTLSLGAGWGAWLLWRIGAEGNFNAVSAADVIAHGEAQLWGFLALFIMGIALRTVLQSVPRRAAGAWACRGLLMLALFGIGGGFLWFLFPAAVAMGLAAAASLVLMSIGYLTMQVTALRRKWPATWARAVIASGLWLVAWAVVTISLRWTAGVIGPGNYSNSERLLLIELAVFGFAMNSIYGFGQMLLPGLLRVGSTRHWAMELSHWVHNIGALLVCLATGWEWPTMMSVAGCAVLATGAVLFAVGNRGFVGRRRTWQREEKGAAPLDIYPPLAFFWLVASLILLTCGFLYESASGSLLPHAYMGAVRHALTVGFMTTLILGIGQRLLPVLDRTVLAQPRLVVPILGLIGVGNMIRVGTELATIVTPVAYGIMPLSAVLEWTALLLFALNAVATMLHKDPLLSRGRVTARSSLAVLLGEYPEIEDRLLAAGSQYLGRARSVPSELTIGSFAESEGHVPAEFVDQINAWLRDLGRNRDGGVATALK